jgi:uncharacterized protein (DUF924 family)
VTASWSAVLEFWFGAADSPELGRHRRQWFEKSDAFDALVRDRFLATHEAAAAGALDAWAERPLAALALVIALDQFPRNVFRGDAAGDRAYLPAQAWFAYLPFEHAEALGAQAESLALFERLRGDPPSASPIAYAQRHYAVIERFGRFPHRNAILGRASTPEEVAFLATPGSSF